MTASPERATLPDTRRWVTFRSVVARLLVVAAVVVSGQNDTRPSWQARSLGTTPLRHAAFMEAYFSEDTSLEYVDRWTIYVSTFDSVGGLDEVYRVRAPGRYMDPAQWNVELMDLSAYWPNNPDYLPSSVAGAEGVIWTSGFLVPGKGDGMLQMYDTTQDSVPPAVDIASLDNQEWSYHRVVWKDMDLDGDLDALTARFDMDDQGGISSEFLWLENEGNGFVGGWPQHLLAINGPDISFALVTLTAGGRTYKDCIVMGEFFNQKMTIYWTESEDGSWTDTSLVKSRLISEDCGQVFDVLVDDFNRDGVLEFLATEFNKDTGIGQVTMYFFPDDFRTDPFTSFKIADNFIPNPAIGSENMSPGSPKAYYPNAEFAAGVAEDGLPHKPYILLSGDDDGRIYVLFPNSDLRDDWLYEKHILLDTEKTTIGKMAHGDFNGDGYEEVAVAGYSIGQLYLYTYAP
ncbi:uncharacterized protein LOC127009866 [Eriocheir sinensis]|uniref:uncharacterized protein LOC127009866 n=1 Tax=Eriocheir sinensis TaxID=95602 RepID=UPI0021CA2FF6|nr:uncharacterized protein LOC127009866 [Eriocheir sinensis]